MNEANRVVPVDGDVAQRRDGTNFSDNERKEVDNSPPFVDNDKPSDDQQHGTGPGEQV